MPHRAFIDRARGRVLVRVATATVSAATVFTLAAPLAHAARAAEQTCPQTRVWISDTDEKGAPIVRVAPATCRDNATCATPSLGSVTVHEPGVRWLVPADPQLRSSATQCSTLSSPAATSSVKAASSASGTMLIPSPGRAVIVDEHGVSRIAFAVEAE